MKKGNFGYSARRDFAQRSLRYSTAVVSSDLRRSRLVLLSIITLIWITVLVFRLYSLQLSDFSRWQASAVKQHFTELSLAPERGPIFDRNGKIMAVSVPSGSVWARPRQIEDKEGLSKSLASVLELDVKQVRTKLDDRKPFVWIKRQVPKVQADRVADLKLKGVGYFIEARRYYPYNEAASTLIGKVGIDGNGLSGLEGVYEKQLSGTAQSSKLTRDALGNMIQVGFSSESSELPKGKALSLTIDADLQQIVDEELLKGYEKANAKAAMALLVDADNGDILAMSQAPGVNFNSARVKSRSALKNLVVETVFEPGSILKPIIAAAAIEAGVISPNQIIDCEKGSFRIGRHLINDVHPSEDLSFHDVVVRSSNIGMSKVGIMLGKERLYSSLKELGFGSYSGLKLPGETAGILRPVSRWANVDVATHAFGQGIAVNPLQIVRAVSAIANGGYLPALSLVADMPKEEAKQVFSPRTAAAAQAMMYGVVEDEHGTGKRAAIQGIKIGGKTGTAQKAREDGRGYEPGSYVASFVGFADPGTIGLKRRLTLLVSIDRPNTTSIYGGTLAAPVFKRIMQRSLHLLSTRNRVNPRFDGLIPAPENGENLKRWGADVTRASFRP